MNDSQVKVPNKFKQTRKRPHNRMVGWLAIFVCTQVGLNVTKQHILQNFKGFINEIVTAQPQELPREHKNHGHRRTQKPRYVREPTLRAIYARVSGQKSTLPSRHSQGSTAEIRAFGRTCDLTREVTCRVGNLCRTRISFSAKKELITPTPKVQPTHYKRHSCKFPECQQWHR